MRSDDPERTAIHEAGHAAMAYTLGRRVGIVSIRGGPDYFGIATYPGKPYREPPGGVMAQLDRPLPLMNAVFRRSIETEIMVSVAGYITVSLYGPYRGPGFEAVDPDEYRAAEARVRRLAAELLTHEVLSAKAVRRILSEGHQSPADRPSTSVG